jgi:hypothetical protein
MEATRRVDKVFLKKQPQFLPGLTIEAIRSTNLSINILQMVFGLAKYAAADVILD